MQGGKEANPGSDVGDRETEGRSDWRSTFRRANFTLGCFSFALGAIAINPTKLQGLPLYALVFFLALLSAITSVAVSLIYSGAVWVGKRLTHWLLSPESVIRTRARKVTPEARRGLRLVLTVAGCMASGALVVLVVNGIVQDHRRGCSTPVEVPVAASPQMYETASTLARAFERSTARRHDGCPQADLSVYAVDSSAFRQGLPANWTTRDGDPGSPNYLRDLGPRPQLWLPDSTVDVDRLIRAIDQNHTGPELGRPVIFGGSELVLAVPADQDRPAGPVPGDWPALIAAYSRAKFQVVGPDSTTSADGQALLAATYPTGAHWNDRQFAAARSIESVLATGRAKAKYPLGDAATLLRQYRQTQCSGVRVALIVPEQFATRPAYAGPPVRIDPDCAESGPHPLTTIQPLRTVVMNRPLLPIIWPGDDVTGTDSAAGTAADFSHWLATANGQAVIESTGLTPGGRGSGLDRQLLDRIDAALRQRSEIARPAEILFAIDTSGSMATRLDLGAAVLDATVDRLSDTDQLGLLTFGGDRARVLQAVRPAQAPAGGDPADVAGPGRSTRDAVRRALGALKAAGGTPLHQAFQTGVRLLLDRPADATSRPPTIRALVVMTDGRDTADGGTKPFVVARDARQGGVQVFVVAAGSIDCSLPDLTTITQSSGGRCINARGGPETIADQLAAAIWGI